MASYYSSDKNLDIEFQGKGSKLFEIQLANWVLTFVTLGIYYPWAKANVLRYTYAKTKLSGSAFTFHGTGKEMFMGYLKTMGLVIAFWGAMIYAAFTEALILIQVIYLVSFLAIILLLPIAIHGRMRYRMSRTSWRGIHFGYRGSLKTLSLTFYRDFLFTILSLGIYRAWMEVNLRRYVISNVRMGNISFRFDGSGTELFMIHLKGTVLSILTLGIYFFWYIRDLHIFYMNNTLLEQNETLVRLDSTVTGFGYVKLIIGNMLIVLFTLGFGSPWATVRSLRFIINNTDLLGDFDPNSLLQTEEEYKDAVFEDMSDMLDLGWV